VYTRRAQAGVAAVSKLDAALSVLQNAVEEPATYAALVVANTWTITITQP
jgi:hypothetical protein